jgi:hypothetical protein
MLIIARVIDYALIELQVSAKRRQQRSSSSDPEPTSKAVEKNAQLIEESFSWMTSVLTCGSNGAGQLAPDAVRSVLLDPMESDTVVLSHCC